MSLKSILIHPSADYCRPVRICEFEFAEMPTADVSAYS
jgi:hypothetical protein